ncbi:MAG: hypothetical protein ACTTJV_03740 [Ottowia sp.]
MPLNIGEASSDGNQRGSITVQGNTFRMLEKNLSYTEAVDISTNAATIAIRDNTFELRGPLDNPYFRITGKAQSASRLEMERNTIRADAANLPGHWLSPTHLNVTVRGNQYNGQPITDR